jgi:FAD:protein FMN transferase
MRHEFKATGTSWRIDILDDVSQSIADDILARIRMRIEEFEQAYSRFREDSIVGKISRTAGGYAFPNDAKPMMDLYRALYEITGGLMTPLVGRILVDAGYDASYSLKPKEVIRAAPKWEDAIRYEHPILTTKSPIQLDFGALGKGYIIDIISRLIEESGVSKYTVDAGGDIRTTIPLRIGLEDPEDASRVVGIAEVDCQSICGSAGNRRAWGKYHHIINPKTVESPQHISALWVVADTTILADALSTALFFVSPEELLKKYRFEFVILYKDKTARVSSQFPGKLFEV